MKKRQFNGVVSKLKEVVGLVLKNIRDWTIRYSVFVESKVREYPIIIVVILGLDLVLVPLAICLEPTNEISPIVSSEAKVSSESFLDDVSTSSRESDAVSYLDSMSSMNALDSAVDQVDSLDSNNDSVNEVEPVDSLDSLDSSNDSVNEVEPVDSLDSLDSNNDSINEVEPVDSLDESALPEIVIPDGAIVKASAEVEEDPELKFEQNSGSTIAYTDSEFLYLCKIVEHEVGCYYWQWPGQDLDYIQQLMAATVVNRVKASSDLFPDTISEVLFAKEQFCSQWELDSYTLEGDGSNESCNTFINVEKVLNGTSDVPSNICYEASSLGSCNAYPYAYYTTSWGSTIIFGCQTNYY